MIALRAATTILLLVSTLVAVGCQPRPTDRPDGAVEGDSDAGSVTDGAADAEWDALDGHTATDSGTGRDGGPGPITLVTTEAAIIVERHCDLDGDGVADNAIADLGSPESTLLAAALSTFIQGRINERMRYLLHIPRVEDRAGPTDSEIVLVAYRGIETDSPENLGDDFSGEEPFFVAPGQLDPCGEPTAFFESAAIDDGELTTEAGSIALPLIGQVALQGAKTTGSLSPYGEAGEALICGYASILELGSELLEEAGEEGLTILEGLLLGGAVFGMPVVPGVTVDVDTDGDGLERFELDNDGRITVCIDGDRTTIPGRDCWMDPRMADGISINLRLVAVSAVFAGREPGWEAEVPGECEELPERSLFDPS